MRRVAIGALAKFALGVVLVALAAIPSVAGDSQTMINTGPDSVAIRGYDMVAYFTEGRPMQGKPEFAFSWQDAEWHFASAKHRGQFAADPMRYAPQFGGFCAMALTENEVKVVDPEAWTIVDGKLYLNFSKAGRVKFRRDLPGNIEKSEGNWAQIRQEN